MKNKNRTLNLFFFTAKIKIGLRTSLFPPLENDNRTSYQVLLSGKKKRTSQLFFSLRKIKIGLRTYCFLCEKKDQTLHQFFPHRKKKKWTLLLIFSLRKQKIGFRTSFSSARKWPSDVTPVFFSAQKGQKGQPDFKHNFTTAKNKGRTSHHFSPLRKNLNLHGFFILQKIII